MTLFSGYLEIEQMDFAFTCFIIDKWKGFMKLSLILLEDLLPELILPVEIDASKRALAWLSRAGITNYSNHSAASSALRSAAYTYVVAALSSLATLIYYIMIYLGRRD